MAKKFTSTIAGASFLITVVGLIGRGLGLIREVIFANFFGLNVEYDLYLVGAVLPITINTIILYLGQNYFIPNYNKIKIESEEKVRRFTNSTFWLFVLGGIILCAILFLFSQRIVELYLQNNSFSSVETTITVFRIFILTIPFNAAASILSAYLQAEFEYKFPAYSQLLLNVAVIFLVIFFSSDWGILTIPLGYIWGSILQAIYLLLKSKKVIRLNIIKLFHDKSVLIFINLSFLLTVLIESISQIYLLADRYLFNEVDKGGIAALNYALNLFVLPISIISVALSTALFPKLSRSYSENSHVELESSINSFFSMNVFLFVPISIIFILYGDVIIKLLFQRGAFNVNDTLMTFEVIKIYSLSLIFYSSYVVINKLLYSAEMVKQLLIITILGCVLKVVLNFALVKSMQQQGLALSSTLSYIFFFLASIFLVNKRLNINNKTLFVRELIFSIANAAVSYYVSALIGELNIFNNATALELLKIVVFVAVYFTNGYLTEHKSFKLLYELFRNLKSVRIDNI